MTDRIADSQIRWPKEFLPSEAPIHVRNELRMNVPAQVVWAWLARAVRWPEWYPNSANVRLMNQEGSDLRQGTVFRWKTFGVDLESEVMESVPGQRLAWNARSLGVWAYHAWLITPVEGGCEVLTEETQHGWLARLGKLLFPKRMFRGHQVWLEELRRKAEGGLPE